MNRIDILEQKLNILYEFLHEKLTSQEQAKLEEAFARVDDRADGYDPEEDD